MKFPVKKPPASQPAFPVQKAKTDPVVIDYGEQIHADPSKPIWFGIAVLVLGFGGFMAWALLAPLDEGVPTPGVVTVDTKAKAVQHLTGGIVDKILVKEGEVVKEGQVLVKLSPVHAQSQLDIVKTQYLGDLAIENRLIAEYTDKPEIRFSDELLAEKDSPIVKKDMEVQRQLFNTRRESIKRELAILRDSINGLAIQVQGMRDLAKDGYVPRNKMLEIERMYAEMQIRILQREHEYRKEVESQLSDIRKETATQQARLLAAEDELNRIDIRSPADGVVVGLAIHTVGGVIQPGAKLMDIVPEHEPLIVEAQVQPNLINRLHAGLKADLRFTALDPRRTPVVEGDVVTVSADRLTDPHTNTPYYLARVSVTPEGLKKLGDKKIQPGMPVEVIIKTGTRSFMDYLLKPFLDRLAASFTEH